MDSDDCTDDIQVLERDALAGRITILKTAHEQQLVTECELLSIMQSILRSRNAFRLFVSDKFTGVHIKNRQSTGGSKWFIGRLCRRLLLCVPEEIEERVDTSFGFVSGQAFAAGFDIVRIKISVGSKKIFAPLTTCVYFSPHCDLPSDIAMELFS